jgi:hypothetical protein
MPEDYIPDEEDAEIEKIVETAKEIKLEPKKTRVKKPRKVKPEAEQIPKILVAPVLKAPPVENKVSYVITTEEKVTAPVVPEVKPETKITLSSQIEQPVTIETVKSTLSAQGKEQLPESKVLTAQDILTKSEEELKALDVSKRETHNMLQDMKIITAILLGKNKNKELSQALQTDKSFTSKQIKDLEEKGLVKREGEGKDVSYEVDSWNVLKFLQSKIVIKWKKEQEKKEGETK